MACHTNQVWSRVQELHKPKRSWPGQDSAVKLDTVELSQLPQAPDPSQKVQPSQLMTKILCITLKKVRAASLTRQSEQLSEDPPSPFQDSAVSLAAQRGPETESTHSSSPTPLDMKEVTELPGAPQPAGVQPRMGNHRHLHFIRQITGLAHNKVVEERQQ
ncbi:uncharacterized protein LOC120838307 [Ixodes scapularis]|uniref:uncharacterized protein LOC120838307 n=1 Tax=Ixodes scapularis TaxID=6945 RepID=UPI001C3941BD|nr:uncharacterized protein LOC120838307 [Ixodes scapularis]